MYQPALRPDQVKALYYLKRKLARPMTELARDAVDDYLKLFGGPQKILPEAERTHRQAKRRSRRNTLEQVQGARNPRSR